MDYVVGLVLGVAACGLGTLVGFERDRALYPVMMIVIASYYVLFAVLGGDSDALGAEIAISILFIGLAVIGFRASLWLVLASRRTFPRSTWQRRSARTKRTFR